MRPDCVVILTPLFDHDLGFFQTVEDFPVEKFVAKLAVEVFIVAILPRAARRDEQLIESERSGPFERDGHLVEVHIYKLEHDKEWVLEVVDEGGTSMVWDDKFRTDRIAWKEFLRTIEKEGMAAVSGPIKQQQMH